MVNIGTGKIPYDLLTTWTSREVCPGFSLLYLYWLHTLDLCNGIKLGFSTDLLPLESHLFEKFWNVGTMVHEFGQFDFSRRIA